MKLRIARKVLLSQSKKYRGSTLARAKKRFKWHAAMAFLVSQLSYTEVSFSGINHCPVVDSTW